jgi:hypothetical protein
MEPVKPPRPGSGWCQRAVIYNLITAMVGGIALDRVDDL